MNTPDSKSPDIAALSRRARDSFAALLSGDAPHPWWDALVVTASSERQAKAYREEIAWRTESGRLPGKCTYLVAPDLNDQRLGSGGATINALRVLAGEHLPREREAPGSLEDWWNRLRVLVVHGGGESRRLPQYSLRGKLFSAVPVPTPWGQTSTVFDEIMALSTGWVRQMENGLMVSSGDVIVTFDGAELNLGRPGVTGVAVVQPAASGSQHGVYAADEQGRVHSFLQKPSTAKVSAAGGLLDGGQVALDSGLLRFDPPVAARLTELAGAAKSDGRWHIGTGILNFGGLPPAIDLYAHITLGLTGEWSPAPSDAPYWHLLAGALRNTPFWCCLVRGEFTHVGSTSHFRRLFTADNEYLRLFAAQQSYGAAVPEGLDCAGVIVDSVLEGGGEIQPGAIVIECDLAGPLRVERGAILHGLNGLTGPVEAPEDTVLHQVAVRETDGSQAFLIRAYGVADDPPTLVSDGATWFGRPLPDHLSQLGLSADEVWPDTAAPLRSLWNARLFPAATLELAWSAARWMLGYGDGFDASDWRRLPRMSLATSTHSEDLRYAEQARLRRHRKHWRTSAISLARGGTDVRPLLAYSPGVEPLVEAGKALAADAERLLTSEPTEAATRYFQASQFLGQAGLAERAGECRSAAYLAVRQAVDAGVYENAFQGAGERWAGPEVTVCAPPRVDFGGGWSDTPPFCLDWGGTVLNAAIVLEGEYPIRTRLRTLSEPVVRCISEETEESTEFRTTGEIYAPAAPGDTFAIPRIALQLAGIPAAGDDLRDCLRGRGGGLEIRTSVRLPMGSGLGTSSILAATLLSAVGRLAGIEPGPEALCDQVMLLEQKLTAGGGWQDQVGGIYPGVKMVHSGPGLRQRLRVQPLDWEPEREAEFSRRFLLYYTGIRRIAKNLLAQVVASYLAREVATVQVLHSIKTLAMEMAYAMREGDWDYLGRTMNRHWELNQILDPHTTSAPINALLAEMHPYVAGAKLAGAGGGGFLMLVCRDEEAAATLVRKMNGRGGGRFYSFEIAPRGLHAI